RVVRKCSCFIPLIDSKQKIVKFVLQQLHSEPKLHLRFSQEQSFAIEADVVPVRPLDKRYRTNYRRQGSVAVKYRALQFAPKINVLGLISRCVDICHV